MIILNEPLELCTVDSKFVQGMMYKYKDKNKCYCSC